MPTNVLFAWIWILCGLVSGTALGMFFHRQDWLGGYDSWQRRMLRLGHISFLGTGLLNLGYGLCIAVLKVTPQPRLSSAAFILGAATMPLVCFLSAWNHRWRHLFFIPVASLLLGTGEVLWVSLFS
jgi:hypothetical protein